MFSLTDFYSSESHCFQLNTKQKADRDFIVTSKRYKIQLNEKSNLPPKILPNSKSQVKLWFKS